MAKDADTGKPVHGHWGGYDNDFGPSWWQVVMIIGAPLFVYYTLACATLANWGVWVPSEWSLAGLAEMFPAWETKAVYYYFGFVAFQLLTYLIVPGHIAEGPVTPAGNKQLFKINSLACWFVNVFCFFLFGVHAKWFDASYASTHLGALFNVGCVFGFVFSAAAYIKGRVAPTNSDAAVRNEFVQDFFLGIELSPRLPFTSPSSLWGLLDSKLFCIGHCGMISWTILNLSHAVAQYERLGFVTVSMVLCNLFQAAYTVDWAWKEVWYLYTIDMRHDRLGWYLGWGSFGWLFVMYCLQCYFLSMNAVDVSRVEAALIVGVFVLGLVLFRLANNQKDEFRANPKVPIWGSPARYIEAQYATGDGKAHRSLLLCSGYWGVSRHFNYVSDLIMCLAFSLPCRSAVLPYFYLVYMFALLLHRSIRDDRKCRAKYGAYWDAYCKEVPYVLVPGIY